MVGYARYYDMPAKNEFLPSWQEFIFAGQHIIGTLSALAQSEILIPPDVLEKLCAQDWKSLFPALVAYAEKRVKRLTWRSGKGELPGGLEPKDLAKKAIEAVFEGSRKWNPAKDPDIFKYLRGIVNSNVSHLVESAGHVRRIYQAQTNSDEDGVPLPINDPEAGDSSPEEELIAKDLFEYLWREAKGDKAIEAILLCVDDGVVKRSDIAHEFGISVDEVTNAKKRLKRIIDQSDRINN